MRIFKLLLILQILAMAYSCTCERTNDKQQDNRTNYNEIENIQDTQQLEIDRRAVDDSPEEKWEEIDTAYYQEIMEMISSY